jgi:ribonuclease BN (tRNA processing enzyme)
MAILSVIGSGDAFGTGGKFHTCFWLENEGKNILIDCGANAPLAIKKAGKSIDDIDAIFITHFHGDHFGGLPFLLTELAYVVKDTDHVIDILGPEGVQRRVLDLQEAMYAGSLEYIEPITRFHEYSQTSELLDLKIQSFPAIHSEQSNPKGIRIEMSDRSMAYSGDGEWSDSLIQMSESTDLMIIECYDFDKQTPGHLNYKTIEKNRRLLKCSELYLTHHGPEMINRADSLEIPSLYDGMELEF